MPDRPPGPAAHRRPDRDAGRERSALGLQPTPELLGPDEELVAGRRPVEEAFVARRDAIRLLVVPQRRQALERLVLHATSLRIPIVEVEGGTLTAIAGFDGHQGIALVVAPRRYATLAEILGRAAERGEPPFVLVLDSLEDPQNVGTLLRSAEAAGVHGVVFPTHRQAPLTPAAVKASAGAVEHLLLAPVDDLAVALADLHIGGLRIAGAEADAPLTVREADLRGPLALVVGSEGQGLGPAVRRRCDLLMRIPMRGVIGSLNASVAGSILLFEAVGQRFPSGERSVPPRAAVIDGAVIDEPLVDEPSVDERSVDEPSVDEPSVDERSDDAASVDASPIAGALGGPPDPASGRTPGPQADAEPARAAAPRTRPRQRETKPDPAPADAPPRTRRRRPTVDRDPAPETGTPDELLPGGPAAIQPEDPAPADAPPRTRRRRA